MDSQLLKSIGLISVKMVPRSGFCFAKSYARNKVICGLHRRKLLCRLTPYFYSANPCSLPIISAISWHKDCSSSWLGPSAMTRMSGSVPDARTKTRPSSPSSPSAVTIAALMRSLSSQPVYVATRTFTRTCGYFVIMPANSERGCFFSFIRAAT